MASRYVSVKSEQTIGLRKSGEANILMTFVARVAQVTGRSMLVFKIVFEKGIMCYPIHFDTTFNAHKSCTPESAHSRDGIRTDTQLWSN